MILNINGRHKDKSTFRDGVPNTSVTPGQVTITSLLRPPKKARA